MKLRIKNTRKIYDELGMQLRNKTPKRRVKAKLRDDRAEAVSTNDVWQWILSMTNSPRAISCGF